MKRSKRRGLLLCLTIETIALLLVICCVILQFFLKRPRELLREMSPNQEYLLVITELGEPKSLYGPDSLRVSMRNVDKNSNYALEFETDVYNDGGEASYEVEWMDDGVQIVLIGSEQPDAYYFLPFEQ